jgi:aspartate 1-decarboxylase
MLRTLLKSKIAENEQVHSWNINNRQRFVTCAIKGESCSGMISVNGSSARRAAVGDLNIVAAFAQVHEDKVDAHVPQLVFLDACNKQTALRHQVATQQQ